jgi:hypothetical protein
LGNKETQVDWYDATFSSDCFRLSAGFRRKQHDAYLLEINAVDSNGNHQNWLIVVHYCCDLNFLFAAVVDQHPFSSAPMISNPYVHRQRKLEQDVKTCGCWFRQSASRFESPSHPAQNRAYTA